VQKTNHGGGAPFLRGLTGNQTLLMLDGIRVNTAIFRFGPNQYANLIDAYTLQRIEIVKGSGSVQYGSDALGGVMHALTRSIPLDGPRGWFARAGVRITSRDMEYTGRADAGYTGRKFGFAGGYTWRKFGDLYGGDTTGKQSPSGYDEVDWDMKARLALGKGLYLTASAQQVHQSDVPLYHRIQLEKFDYYRFNPQRLLISYMRLESNSEQHMLHSWSITPLFKKSVEGRQYHRNGSADYFDEADVTESYGIVAETNWKFSPGWSSGTGAELYYDDVSSSRAVTNGGNLISRRGLYPDGASQVNASVYSLHHFTRKQWRAEAGLRYNIVQNRIPGEFLDLPGNRSGDATIQADAVVGNLSLLYNLHGRHAFYTSLSTGFRAPGIDDLGTLGLVDFRYELPAYDLEPEKSIDTELGYRYRGQKLQLQASIFYLKLKDLISRTRSGTDSIQGYPVFIKTNDQEAFIRGFDLAGTYELIPGLVFSANLAAQYGQNLTRNEPVRRIPPTHGMGMVRYGKRHWYLAADMQWALEQDRLAQGDKDDNRIPAGGTPGWEVVNLLFGYVYNAWELRARLSNIFNEDYRTHGSGINGMGRAVTVAMMVAF
jgi:outer membrane receptor protein involved in Fe transport